MSIIVEYSVTSPELALYDATTIVPEVRVELTDMVATDPQQPVMFFWVVDGDQAAFDSALESDESVREVRIYADTDERRLYRIVLSPETGVVSYPRWVSAGGGLIKATCQGGMWSGTMRFPDRGALQEVVHWFKENDIVLTINAIYDEHGAEKPIANGLSSGQERTLKRAYEMGHYEIPQRATAAEVAETLDVSQQAVSERLRRAYANLIQRHVLDGTE